MESATTARQLVATYAVLRIITLEVHDDGVGFDPQGEYPGHLGLRSMRERAAQIVAALEIESAPGLGTQVKVRVYLSRGT
jgi:signal transduction histidine kinase